MIIPDRKTRNCTWQIQWYKYHLLFFTTTRTTTTKPNPDQRERFEEEPKCLHKYLPLAMSTNVQNPDSKAKRTLEQGDWFLVVSVLSSASRRTSSESCCCGDLRFLMTKKPARVAERKMRISLSGHISLSLSFNSKIFCFFNSIEWMKEEMVKK